MGRRGQTAYQYPYWTFGIFAASWLLVLCGSLYMHYVDGREQLVSLARLQAESVYATTIVHRQWNADKGGVYAFVSEATPENPYLKHPDKNLTTTDGRQLTMINPAYMTRQVHELMAERFNIYEGRLVSDNPINPDNKPDAWEWRGLQAFSEGSTEYYSMERTADGSPIFRFGKALYVTQNCLSCHAEQGYREGDLRGMLSVQLPVDPILAEIDEEFSHDIANHLVFAILGFAAIGGAAFTTLRQEGRRSSLLGELKQRDELLRAVNNGIPGMLFQARLDEAGRFTLPYVNRASSAIFGLPPSELDRSSTQLMKRVERADVLRLMRSMVRSARHLLDLRVQFRISHPDGRPRWVEVHAVPIRKADKSVVWNGYVSDITHLKELEASLLEARDEAEVANRTKGDFLAMMSHEIRTPMNGILGLADILMESRLDEEQQEILSTIKKSADTLMVVLNDVLDYSKIVSGKITLEDLEFDLESSIHATIHLFAGQAERKGVEIILDYAPELPRHFKGDPNRIRQVLINLLSNSVKFTQQGEIVVSVSGEPDRMLKLAVRDSGIGLPADFLETIFQPFNQGETSTSRRFGGTGLGLSISRQLVQAMGGTIVASNNPEGGAVFCVYIPLKPVKNPPSEKRCHALPGTTKPRVLFVDDNPINREVMQRQLSVLGVETVIASSAASGIECLRDGSFDLVISDYMMPEVNGIDFAHQAKALPGMRSVPLYLLSSAGTQMDLDPEHLFTRVLQKPLSFEALGRIVRSLETREHLAEVPHQAKAGKAPDYSRLRVLVCEDNTVNQRVITLLLNKCGIHPTVVGDGQAGLQAMLAETFDLVFMDIQMPELSGLEATEAARRRLGQKMPIVVAMTASALEGDRERFIDGGMQDHLPKPVRLHTLQACLMKFFPEF